MGIQIQKSDNNNNNNNNNSYYYYYYYYYYYFSIEIKCLLLIERNIVNSAWTE